jgi:hypothetical protein
VSETIRYYAVYDGARDGEADFPGNGRNRYSCFPGNCFETGAYDSLLAARSWTPLTTVAPPEVVMPLSRYMES